MSAHLSNSLVLDGYRLIRFLGRGGFGEVWLCRSESMGDYRALKFIPTSHADRLEKEYEALLHFRKAAARLRSPHLVSIEHVGHNEAGLYYVMPLADGSGAADPSDLAWVPVSLTTMIQGRSEMPTWFSSREIIALVQPVLEALQTLSDGGVTHADLQAVAAMATVTNLGAENNFHDSGWHSFWQWDGAVPSYAPSRYDAAILTCSRS
jgi:serine/threonine protein kinase